MKILVTGSSGRVGRAIYIALSHHHQVRGLDRSPASTADIVADFTQPGVLADALRGMDAVVHVAGLHAPHVGHLPDAEFSRINVDGIHLLRDACVAAGVARIVFTSTTALYGHAATPEGRAGWVTETTEPDPRTIYHRTKLAGEAILREAAEQGGPEVRIMRMSRCFPEPANMMAAYRLHRGVDARDVASGHLAALMDSSTAAADTFILSGDTPFLPEDVERLWAYPVEILKSRAPELVAAFQGRGWALPGRIDRVYSSARASDRLGWRSRFGFEDVLANYDLQSYELLAAR